MCTVETSRPVIEADRGAAEAHGSAVGSPRQQLEAFSLVHIEAARVLSGLPTPSEITLTRTSP